MQSYTNVAVFSLVALIGLSVTFLFGPSNLAPYVYKHGGTSFPDLDGKYNRWQKDRMSFAGAGLMFSLVSPWIFGSHLVWLGILFVSMMSIGVLDLVKLAALVDDLDGR